MAKLNQSAAEILKRRDGSRDLSTFVSEFEQAFGSMGLQQGVEDFL